MRARTLELAISVNITSEDKCRAKKRSMHCNYDATSSRGQQGCRAQGSGSSVLPARLSFVGLLSPPRFRSPPSFLPPLLLALDSICLLRCSRPLALHLPAPALP